MASAEVSELLSLLGRTDVTSFAGGIPDPTLFPTAAIRAAYDAVLSDERQAATALQYSVPEGFPPLRAWIAEDMRRRGLTCSAENVLITSGSQQALDFVGKLFNSPDDTVLLSWPTFLGALQAFNAYEPRYAPLPEPGSNFAAAADGPGRSKFGYVMPEFENPTGRTLTRGDRERLLDFADAADIPLIEDSPYETLRYAGEAPPSLIGLAAARAGGIDSCRLIYLGTFSKSIAPALRIGWMVGPKTVIARLALVKQASDIQVSTINQMVMHRVAPAIVPVQAARAQSVYRARRDAMLQALRTHMPDGVAWTEPEGGFFIWVTLPRPLDAAVMLRRAVDEAKVGFVPGPAFFPDRSGRNTLRLSFSLNDAKTTDQGIFRLAALIRDSLHAV